MFAFKIPVAVLIASFLTVSCAPINITEEDNEVASNQQPYDLSEFSEVYDQRQNGTENYRVDVNGVVLVWSPPGGLLQAATLLDPSVFDSDYSDLEGLFSQEKPSGGTVEEVKPGEISSTEAPSTTTSTTTIRAPEVPVLTVKGQASKRKFRLPELIRPFVRRHPST